MGSHSVKDLAREFCGNIVYMCDGVSVYVRLFLADMSQDGFVAGAKNWQRRNRKAYGISMSLYDQHPITGKISGLYLTLIFW